MANPWTHAKSSAKKYGGDVTDYLAIHKFMDSSKSAVADNRHRAVLHNTFGIYHILPLVFGDTLTNSEGKVVPVTMIGYDHVSEDYRGKFIPTLQDYLVHMEIQPWMNNAMGDDVPSSYKSIKGKKKSVVPPLETEEVFLDGANKYRLLAAQTTEDLRQTAAID